MCRIVVRGPYENRPAMLRSIAAVTGESVKELKRFGFELHGLNAPPRQRRKSAVRPIRSR
jgi:hypothetical protein